MKIKRPNNPKPLLQLDAGEAAAINLAKQENAELLLIDEHAGREIAMSSDWRLRITGTIGVLERAATNGLLELAEAFTRLREAKFHVSEQIVQEALARDAVQRQARPPH